MSTAPSPLSSKKLGLYIHFPFCAYKCGYCDFNSWVEHDSEPQRQWLKGIKNEVRYWKSLQSGAFMGFEIDTLFMGGGTPSLLRAELWDELVIFLKAELPFVGQMEWTVEANPETIRIDLLQQLSELGVNRLSLGIQSFKEKFLKRLERGATPESNRKALNLLSEHWKGRWSLDLMFGLPLQTLEEWREDLSEALLFSPKHLSAYQLTLTTQKSKAWQQGTDTELLEFFKVARETLATSGLRPYEISNFSQPQFESQHNLKYWKADSFLGLGPGAYSLLPADFFTHAPWGAHFKTPSRMDEWLRWTQAPHVEKAEQRSEKDHVTELLMLGLRLEEGVEKSRFPIGFSWNFLDDYSHLVEQNSIKIQATSRGREILDTTVLELISRLYP